MCLERRAALRADAAHATLTPECQPSPISCH
jgi:hypothetical protein